MARKLDELQELIANEDIPRVGRRDYVKVGMLSTLAGAGIISASMPGAADEPETIHVVGAGDLATYEITVSGALAGGVDTDIELSKNISGGNAEGTVRDSIHAYQFDGDLEDVRLDGEANIYRNGEPLDRSQIAFR